jgi:hypothetical protein
MQIQRSNPATFFTVLPNQTLRDHELSFTARGILAFLLSLPSGAREDIQSLSAKSSEGRKAVAAALTELQDRGYLMRKRIRGDHGQITTEVVLYDVRDGASSQVAPNAAPVASGGPVVGSSAGNPEESPSKKPSLPVVAAQTISADNATEGREGGELSPAETLLGGLGRYDARLHLSASEVEALAPLVDEWFANGADRNRVMLALTAGLPARVHAPASLVRSRLTAKKPSGAPAKVSTLTRHECGECGRPVASEGLCGGCVASAPAPVVTSGIRNWRDMAKTFGSGALAVA